MERLVEGDGGFRGDEDGVAVSAELNRAAGDVGLGDGIDDGEAGDIGVRERLEFEAVGGDGVEGLFLMAVDVDLLAEGGKVLRAAGDVGVTGGSSLRVSGPQRMRMPLTSKSELETTRVT